MKRIAVIAAVGLLLCGTAASASGSPGRVPGGLVAFSQQAEDDWRLMVMRPDGSRARPLGALSWTMDPDWSPDGRQIAVSGFRPNTFGAAQIFVMSADGKDARAVTFMEGYKRSPSWSPDGRQIAYAAQVLKSEPSVPGMFRASCELRVVDLRTRAERVVHASGGYVGANTPLTEIHAATTDCAGFPRWSPLGDMIAFIKTSSGPAGANDSTADLYVVSPDGSGLRRIVERVSESGVSWSPDGRRIAYVAGDVVEDRTTVRTAAPDGTDVKDVVTLGFDGGFTAYSPDGRSLIFQTNPAGETSAHLFRVSVDGGEPVRLTRGNVHHVIPDWQPRH